MKKLVLINEDFIDVYNPEVMYNAGDQEVFTDERIAEIKTVNPNFVTVIGLVEEPEVEVKDPPEDDGKGKK